MKCPRLGGPSGQRVVPQRERVDRHAALKGRRGREADPDAWDFLERGEEPLRELLLCTVILPVVRRQRDACGDQLAWLKAWIDCQGAFEAANQKPGPSE